MSAVKICGVTNPAMPALGRRGRGCIASIVSRVKRFVELDELSVGGVNAAYPGRSG